MIYLELFLSFLQIGAFSFGGGYAALPLIQEQVIDQYAWMTIGEFNDLVTISQMTPGPIAINAATFVGLKIGGLAGAFAATIGCVLPSCLIVSLLAFVYLKYRKMAVIQDILQSLRPAVVAMIASAGMSILLTTFFGEEGIWHISSLKIQNVVLFILSLILLKKKNMNPIVVMLLAGVMEVIFLFIRLPVVS